MSRKITPPWRVRAERRIHQRRLRAKQAILPAHNARAKRGRPANELRPPPALAPFLNEECACAWKYGAVAKSGRMTKVPYRSETEFARTNDPSTWISFHRAARLAQKPGFEGIGVFLGEMRGGVVLAGLDLDTCRDPKTGKLTRWARKVIRNFRTYCEISPSKSGAKLFFKIGAAELAEVLYLLGEDRLGRKWAQCSDQAHAPAIEFYVGKRFFTVTGMHVAGTPNKIQVVPVKRIRWLFKDAGPALAGALPDANDPALLSSGKAALKKLSKCARSMPKLAALLRGDFSGLEKDKTRSARDFALAGFCKDCGLNCEEAQAAIYAYEFGKGRMCHDAGDARYFERIWEKSRSGGLSRAATAIHRSTIEVTPGELYRIVDEVESALIASGMDLYQYGDALVTPGLKKVSVSGGRMVEVQRLNVVTKDGLLETLSRSVAFANQRGPIDCPHSVASAYLSRPEKKLPHLVGIVNAPTMRADGTILQEPGYDAATRLIYDPRGAAFPRIADNLDLADAIDALVALREPLEEFPFVTEADESVAISAMLSAIMRASLPATPMHGVSAPAAGTGKSLLMDIPSIMATGAALPVSSQGPDEQEIEKRIASSLIEGDCIVSFDNCSRPLKSSLLCQALTQDLINVRLMGHHKNVKVPTAALFFATGNNLRIVGDLTRRTIICALDAKEEHPEQRTFRRRKLLSFVEKQRGALVAAGLTIVRAYKLAGSPLKGKRRPLGSFEAWCETVRDAMIWSGCADPCATMKQVREGDPEREALAALMAPWWKLLGERPILASELIERAIAAKGDSDLLQALSAVAGEGQNINPRRLGAYLSAHQGQVLNGRRFVKAQGRRNVTGWRLEKLS